MGVEIAASSGRIFCRRISWLSIRISWLTSCVRCYLLHETLHMYAHWHVHDNQQQGRRQANLGPQVSLSPPSTLPLLGLLKAPVATAEVTRPKWPPPMHGKPIDPHSLDTHSAH